MNKAALKSINYSNTFLTATLVKKQKMNAQ